MKGIVKWYNFKKGFGFIKGEDDKDYFLHYSTLPKGVVVKEEDEVSFDAVNTDKGEQAQNIKLTKTTSAEPVSKDISEEKTEKQNFTEEPEKKETDIAKESEKLDSEDF
jgi:cold shock protein